MSTSAAAEALGIAGYPVTFVLFASQVPMCLAMRHEGPGSAPHFPFTPTLTLLANALMWAAYGLLTGSTSVAGVNLLGLFSGLCYTVWFSLYAPTHAESLRYWAKAFLALGLAAVPAGILVGLRPPHATDALGGICVAMSVALFSAPLAAVVAAVHTLDAEHVPGFLTLASLASAGIWTAFGVVTGDAFIAGPNIAGCVICTLQLTALGYVRWKRASAGENGLHAHASSKEAELHPHVELLTRHASLRRMKRRKGDGTRHGHGGGAGAGAKAGNKVGVGVGVGVGVEAKEKGELAGSTAVDVESEAGQVEDAGEDGDEDVVESPAAPVPGEQEASPTGLLVVGVAGGEGKV
jgi:solute carrier family 50 protein (sugar transporter)